MYVQGMTERYARCLHAQGVYVIYVRQVYGCGSHARCMHKVYAKRINGAYVRRLRLRLAQGVARFIYFFCSGTGLLNVEMDICDAGPF